MAKNDKNLNTSVIFQNLSRKLEEHGKLMEDYDEYSKKNLKNINKPFPPQFQNISLKK